MASVPIDGQKVKWWETRVAEFLLTLASLAVLAGVVVFMFQLYRYEMHGPTKLQEEAYFYKLIAPHWQPKDFEPNSVVVDRDGGANYGELKQTVPFKGIRMTPLDKESKVWRYDVNGKSYAVHIYWPMNADWILRSIQSKKEDK